MGEGRYSTEQLAEATGVPATTVRWLTGRDVLQPSIQRGEGRGTANVYALQDIVATAVARTLQQPCETLEALRPVFAFFQSRSGKAFFKLSLRKENLYLAITDGGNVLVYTPEDQATEFMRHYGSSTCFIIDVVQVLKKVRVRLAVSGLRAPGVTGRVPRLPNGS